MYLKKFDLSGQTAFITGGGRGIGLATAEALLECGAKVVISDLDPEVLENGRRELGAKGWDADAVQLDVTDADAVGRIFPVDFFHCFFKLNGAGMVVCYFPVFIKQCNGIDIVCFFL